MENAPLSAADVITVFARKSVQHGLLRAFLSRYSHHNALAFCAGYRFVFVITGQSAQFSFQHSPEFTYHMDLAHLTIFSSVHLGLISQLFCGLLLSFS